jgi:uncharacterized protein YecT (DUF1311 family)
VGQDDRHNEKSERKASDMRLISSIFLVAALLQTPLTSAAPATGEDCGAHSQADMRTCLEKKSTASAVMLDQAMQDAASALGRWDEDAAIRASAGTALQASSKSFIQFRQAQCNFVAALGGGAIGNALTLRRLACMAALNEFQAATLRHAVESLPGR